MLRVSRLLFALWIVVPGVTSMQGLPAAAAVDASQDPPRPSAPRTPPPPDTQVTPAAPRALPPPAPPAPARRPRGRDLNVQLEVTINDQLGAAAPEKRVVSMHIADGAFGRIRSNASNGLAILNIDARPEVIENDRIVVELTIEYKPALPDGVQPAKRPAEMNEMLTVILQNGKPLMVSQAADPLTDRKMTLEVRATVAN